MISASAARRLIAALVFSWGHLSCYFQNFDNYNVAHRFFQYRPALTCDNSGHRPEYFPTHPSGVKAFRLPDWDRTSFLLAVMQTLRLLH